MEMPKIDANHERLHRFGGDWQGTERMHPSPRDPKGGEAQGRRRGRVALAGFAVIVDYEQTRGDARTYEGHGVCTRDACAGEVVMHWFDCPGMGAEMFRGKWHGERLQLTNRNVMGSSRLSDDFTRAGGLGAKMELSKDGESWTTFFDATCSRKGS